MNAFILGSSRRFGAILITASAMLLAGCAPATRVTLLPQADGTPSAVEVTTTAGRQLVDKPYQVAEVAKDGRISPAQTTAAEVASRHGTLLALRPAAASRRILNFTAGTSNLTPESLQLLPELLADAAARPGGEFVVVGHTDTTGAAEANDALSLQRAQAVRQLLIQRGATPDSVEAIGRGKRELLVPTADQVDEPRNRRVEVIVR